MASNEDQACALKSCKNKESLHNKSRVEVKSFAPPQVGSFTIDWQRDGQALFHRQCWSDIQRNKHASSEKEAEMIREARKTAEFFDSPELISEKAKVVADLLKNAHHAIAFTGAGISTSAGIGDFRGKGGAWTERDRKKKYGAAAKSSNKRGFSYEALRPTYTHEAIAKLVEMGLIKYVISQNVDGIHRLSGIPAENISELHGNVFHEKCEKCEQRYERSFAARGLHKKAGISKVPQKKCATCRINHRTGGLCTQKDCKGYLMNTIINFGDNLEEDVINNAHVHAQSNDAVLCLGSSLRVTPACDFVTMGKPVRLAICNRQPTPFDDDSQRSGSRVFGDCDDLMRDVMKLVLAEHEFSQWEAGRNERLKQYDSQREIPA